MNRNMSTGFIHSIKVPQVFKKSAKILKKIVEEGASFKSVVFNSKHSNVQGIYALVSETLQHYKELQFIIDKTNIFVENPRFDPWLARILITELLWGKKHLKSEAKPVVIILSYKEKLQQALVQNSDAAVDPCDKKAVKLPRYVRVNTLLTSVDEALEAFNNDGWNLLPQCDNYSSYLQAVSNLNKFDYIQDFHIPEVLVFPHGTKFYQHPGYQNGKLLLQDKASCLSAFLLNPKPNSEVLDMCAAPGMKTTHLAAIINNLGKIYAVEMDENRYKTLCDFIECTNAKCVEAIRADALTILPEQYPNVKYILVDPSCSGSGIVGRFDTNQQDQQDLNSRLKKLHSLQTMILSHALLDFPCVKKVVYSTCSVHSEENESVVDEVLRKVGDSFTLVNLKKKLNNEWNNFGSSEYNFNGDKCLYALPKKDLCSGFFLAMFKRKSKAVNGNINEAHKLRNEHKSSYLNNEYEISETAKDKNELYKSGNVLLANAKRQKAVLNKVEHFVEEKQVSQLKSMKENERNDEGSCEIPPKKVKKRKKEKTREM